MSKATGILVKWKRPLIGGLLSTLPPIIWLSLLAIDPSSPWPEKLMMFLLGGMGPILLVDVLGRGLASSLPFALSVALDLAVWFALGFVLAWRLRRNWQAILAWLLVYVLFTLVAFTAMVCCAS